MMPGLFEARDSANAARRAGPAPFPATIGESLESTINNIRKNDLTISDDVLMRDEYEIYLDSIERASGKRFDNPMDVVSIPLFGVESITSTLLARSRAEVDLESEVKKLSETTEGVFALSPHQIRERVSEVQMIARRERADVEAREGVAGTVASVIGGFGALLTDPPVFATLLAGAPMSAGILRGALIDAGIGIAVEIPVQASIQASRQMLGQRTSLSEATINVLTVGGGGFILSSLLRSGGRGARALIERSKSRAKRPAIDRAAEEVLERVDDIESTTPFRDGDEAGRAEHAERYTNAERTMQEGVAPEISEPRSATRAAPKAPAPKARAALVGIEDAFDIPATAATKSGVAMRKVVARAEPLNEAERQIAQSVDVLLDDLDALPAFLKDVRKPSPKVERLMTFLTRQGGLRDSGGELKNIGITSRARSGFVNKTTGIELDDAALEAFDAGFFPELTERPDINQLLDAIFDDFNNVSPRMSIDDQFNAAVAKDIGQVVDDYADAGIDLLGSSEAEIIRALADLRVRAQDSFVAPSDRGMSRTVSDVEMDTAAFERFETNEDAFDKALFTTVRDDFEGRGGETVVLEDADGNFRTVTADDAFKEIEEDQRMLDSFMECVGL